MVGLIILGVVLIAAGVVVIVLVSLNGSSSGGDPVERFFKKSQVAYMAVLGAALVMGGIATIAGSTQMKPTGAASHHK